MTITNSGNKLVFTSTGNQQIEVSSGDSVIAASLASTNATSRSLQTATSPVPTTGTNTLGFSINGGQKILVSFAGVTGSVPNTANNLQAAIDANTELKAAGLTVDSSMNITSGNQSVNFRVNVESQSGVAWLRRHRRQLGRCVDDHRYGSDDRIERSFADGPGYEQRRVQLRRSSECRSSG